MYLDRGFTMENSYKFFSNTACQYYPCHAYNTEKAGFNCLFCYCPLLGFENCPGNPEYFTTKAGKVIKDCSNCVFPHVPENYDKIMEFLMNS